MSAVEKLPSLNAVVKTEAISVNVTPSSFDVSSSAAKIVKMKSRSTLDVSSARRRRVSVHPFAVTDAVLAFEEAQVASIAASNTASRSVSYEAQAKPVTPIETSTLMSGESVGVAVGVGIGRAVGKLPEVGENDGSKVGAKVPM